MPTYTTCLLCNNILTSSEEKLYGTHYHCQTSKNFVSNSHIFSDKPVHSTVNTKLAILLYNGFVLLLFALILFGFTYI